MTALGEPSPLWAVLLPRPVLLDGMGKQTEKAVGNKPVSSASPSRYSFYLQVAALGSLGDGLKL